MAALSTSLIWDLTKRDFSERFAGSALGSVWAFIWPLVNLFIYIVVFGKFMGGRLPGSSDIYAYSIYLSVGLIPWTAFSNSISRSATVFLDKKNIISKIDVSLPSLLIFINLSETITFIITNVFLFVFLLATGYEFSLKLLLFPLYFLPPAGSCLWIGLTFSNVNRFFEGFKRSGGDYPSVVVLVYADCLCQRYSSGFYEKNCGSQSGFHYYRIISQDIRIPGLPCHIVYGYFDDNCPFFSDRFLFIIPFP